jgi:hypothetical protein
MPTVHWCQPVRRFQDKIMKESSQKYALIRALFFLPTRQAFYFRTHSGGVSYVPWYVSLLPSSSNINLVVVYTVGLPTTGSNRNVELVERCFFSTNAHRFTHSRDAKAQAQSNSINKLESKFDQQYVVINCL